MTYYIYQDKAQGWRWQLVAANNRIIADSGESYVHKQHCLDGINLVKGSSAAPVYQR